MAAVKPFGGDRREAVDGPVDGDVDDDMPALVEFAALLAQTFLCVFQ
jgi:hypothetical protein